jgi:ABC-type dipeptide/oligopeptide/nickel transport system permease subunit
VATDITLDQEQEWGRVERRSAGPWRLFWRALWRRKIARCALIYIVFFYAVGILAPVISPYSYAKQDLSKQAALHGPTRAHPFGTDRLGRDQLSRVIYAARTTAIITVITALTGGLIIGPALGLLAGYAGGWIDSVINRLGEVVASLPDLLVIILLAATVGPRLNDWVANFYDVPVVGSMLKQGFASILVLFFVLTLFGWVGTMRVVRALTLSTRNTDYVTAARASGAGTWRILLHHVLPNISYIVILGVASAFGSVALAEIGLSFLGLGVRRPLPSFGDMILEGFSPRTFDTYPYLLLFPAIFAVVLLLAFNLLGDALNDVLNPKTRDR